MATKAASSSLSPCIRLIEESLLLPTQDVGLFASTFLLIFAHTFAFIAVAVHFAHPLATSLLADIEKALIKTTTMSSHESYSTLVDATTREHAKKLLLIYLAYLASKLATQLAAALAASTTYSGERLTRKAVRERIPSLLSTAAVAGVLELSLMALLVVAPLVSTWTLAASSSGVKSACGYSLLLVALVLNIYLGTVVTVGVAVSVVDRACHGVWALCRAWRLVRAASGKEAAVLVFVVNLLPAVVYPAPVFAFSFVYPAERYSPWYQGDSFPRYYSRVGNQDVWLLSVVSGSGLPSVGAQLFAMAAATVFCCMSMETNNAKGARPVSV